MQEGSAGDEPTMGKKRSDGVREVAVCEQSGAIGNADLGEHDGVGLEKAGGVRLTVWGAGVPEHEETGRTHLPADNTVAGRAGDLDGRRMEYEVRVCTGGGEANRADIEDARRLQCEDPEEGAPEMQE